MLSEEYYRRDFDASESERKRSEGARFADLSPVTVARLPAVPPRPVQSTEAFFAWCDQHKAEEAAADRAFTRLPLAEQQKQLAQLYPECPNPLVSLPASGSACLESASESKM